MSLEGFESLSQKGAKAGLVWSGEVQEGKYFAELQTGVLPQLVHLVIFDVETNYTPVYTALEAFNPGDQLDEAAMLRLQEAIQEGLMVLNTP